MHARSGSPGIQNRMIEFQRMEAAFEMVKQVTLTGTGEISQRIPVVDAEGEEPLAGGTQHIAAWLQAWREAAEERSL